MTYPRFSPAEFQRRVALAHDLMRKQDLKALVIFGNSGMYRHNEANVYWLSNYLDLHHNYLVLPLQGPPALLVGLINHVPNARAMSVIEDTRWGSYQPAAEVAAHLKKQGVVSGRIGLVGVNATFGMGMPYQHYTALSQELSGVEWIDVTRDFAALRVIKSDEEFEWLRKAAEFTDAAVAALEAEARPGLSEFQLVAVVEGAYRPNGGQPHLSYLRSMPMDAPTACVPSQNVTGRIIQKGDVIIMELSASYWGYSGQIQRPIAVGCDPTPEWKRLFEVGSEAYARICNVLGPGATEGDVIRSASTIGEAGYQVYDDLIHGFGVDIQPPLIDRSCCQYWQQKTAPPAGRAIAENMAVVVQPNPITPDERMGLQVGGLTRVTANGAVSLQKYPLQFVVAKG